MTSTVNRIVAALVPLLMIPLALEELGAAGYGAWATATSFATLAAFADLGVGTGLMTRLAASAEPARDRRLVSSAYVMVSVAAALLILLLLVAVMATDLGALLGSDPEKPTRSVSVETVVAVTLAAFALNMVTSFVVRVQYAVGKQGRANLWQAAGSASALGAVLLASTADGGPVWFVACAAFVPVLVASVNTATFFTGTGRAFAPRLGLSTLDVARELLGLGSRFLLISVMMTAVVSLDPWIVARASGLEAVPDFVVPLRLFGFVGAVSVMLALPLWPLHSQAVASGDVIWIRRITRRMTAATTTVVAVGCLLLMLVGPRIVGPWLDGAVVVDPVLWAGLATWWVVQTATGPAFMVQNGAEILGPQTVSYGLLLVTTLPVKWWAATHLGPEWIPWVGAGFYALLIVPACGIGYRRALRRAETSAERQLA